MNPQDLFRTGGLTTNSVGSGGGMQQGPGFGYYGSNDVFRPPSNGQVLGASTSRLSAPSAPMGPSPFDQANQAASSQQDSLLSQLNTQFDQNSSQLNSQLGALGTQKQNAEDSLNTQFSGLQKQVGTSRTNEQSNYDAQTGDALNTAQNVQGQNRNVLRALGILNSSAAGDMLSRPLVEYDKQRAQLGHALQQRFTQLDDFMNQKTAEHSDAVKQIESQYADLTGRIQSDLRFNDRQRADAIRAANGALQQHLSEISLAQMNYQNQVAQMKNQYAQQWQQVNSYQSPTANLSAINSQGVSNPNQNNQTVGISSNDLRKNLLSGGLSL